MGGHVFAYRAVHSITYHAGTSRCPKILGNSTIAGYPTIRYLLCNLVNLIKKIQGFLFHSLQFLNNIYKRNDRDDPRNAPYNVVHVLLASKRCSPPNFIKKEDIHIEHGKTP